MQKCMSTLYPPRRHQPILPVDGDQVRSKAHDCSGTSLGFVQNRKVFRRIGWSAALFDLYRVGKTIASYDQVDLTFVAISVKIKRRALPGVQITFYYLTDYPGLKEGPGCRLPISAEDNPSIGRIPARPATG